MRTLKSLKDKGRCRRNISTGIAASRRKRRIRALARARGSVRTCGRVSGKLLALKSLLPTENTQNDVLSVKPELLFEETADYIIRLRAQIVILQRLIELYNGSGNGSGRKETVAL